MAYLGVDVHHGGYQVSLLSSETGELNTETRAEELRVNCNAEGFGELTKWLESNKAVGSGLKVAIDPTGTFYATPLIQFLHQLQAQVFFVPPIQAKAARRLLAHGTAKTDSIDARTLATLLAFQDEGRLAKNLPSYSAHQYPKETVMLELVRLRARLVKDRTRSRNRLHPLFYAVFPEGEVAHFRLLLRLASTCTSPRDILQLQGSDSLSTKSRRELEVVRNLAKNTVGVSSDGLFRAIHVWASIYSQANSLIKEIEAMLRESVKQHPYGKVLLSFPNVGFVTAGTVIGAIKDIERFPDSRRLRKYCGVYGERNQSGDGSGFDRPGKGGNRDVKRVLFQATAACLIANRGRNDFLEYYERELGKGKPKLRALYAAVGKLIDIIHFCLTNNRVYEYQGLYSRTGTKRAAAPDQTHIEG